MKSFLIALSFLMCTLSYAQDRKSDKKTETETKTVKVKTEKGTVEKRVKVTTKEEGEIKLKENPDHPENMTRVSTDTEVSRTVSFSTDYDPFFESDVESKLYTNEDSEYQFTANDSGFTMSTNAGVEDNSEIGKAMLTSTNKLYLIDMDGNNGIGYFNKNGNFVVEYFDRDSNTLVTKEFSGKKEN